jgi:uncharacterized protein YciI
MSMALFAVTYRYDDRTELRMQTRPEHRAFLRTLGERGGLLEAGAYTDDDSPGGLLIMGGESAEEVGRILDDDPYFRVGVIADRTVRAWGPIIGPWTPASG